MHKVSGGCHCGRLAVDMHLSAAPGTLRPRACDCDYCRKHGAAWVSDPRGSLVVRTQDARELARYRQGSGQAELLTCSVCGVVVCVLHRTDERLYGAVNAAALHGAATFGAEQVVSPRKLAAADKAKRWQDLWFADVRVVEKA